MIRLATTVGALMMLVGGGQAGDQVYKTAVRLDRRCQPYGSQMRPSNIAWSGYDGNDYEIYLYDGAKTIQLTDNMYADYAPAVCDSYVVWSGYDGDDYEIYLYDGARTIQLTDNRYADCTPSRWQPPTRAVCLDQDGWFVAP